MVKKRFFKVITSLACIATLIMPHASIVLAAGLTNDEPNTVNEVELASSWEHQGGTQYHFGGSGSTGTTVQKIYVKGDNTYSDEFYCLNGAASFPTVKAGEAIESIPYKRTITDFFAENPATLGLSDANYNSICWLLDNMYLRSKMTESQKDAFLEKAFANLLADTSVEPRTELDDIKEVISDDAIEVIQQWALWYFTNNGGKTPQGVDFVKNDSSGNPILPVIDKTIVEIASSGESSLKTDSIVGTTEYEWLTILYQYFVNTAKEHATNNTDNSSKIYPTIANKNITCEVDGSEYKIGPFKVTAPKGLSSNDYKIELTDGKNKIDESKYTIKDSSGSVISSKINEIFDTEYYVYISTSEGIQNVTLNLEYTRERTKASIWTADNPTYQTMVLITKDSDDVKDSVSSEISPEADLALRKYIIGLNNDKEITDRIPDINVSKLQDGSNKTAEYKHQKEPVEVKKGDTVTYRISVYNEGDVAVSKVSIADYLPAGLEMAKGNATNEKYGWEVKEIKDGDNVIGSVATTSLSVDGGISAFNKTTGNLQCIDVDIVCEITGDVAGGSVLTNFAEIIDDDIDDRDSTTTSNDSDLKPSSYIGKSGETDLTKKDFFYKGQQDDDDFEKVIIAGKAFDLSLQKFITKVNGKEVDPSRAPQVNTQPLKDGLLDAKYRDDRFGKTPVVISKGDIVTYTIRVYNEGEVDGYAEMVSDYLESGLGFLVNYNGNIENAWAIDEVSELKMNTIKLGDISNGTKNLKIQDFTGITDLSNADVVVGDSYLSLTSKLLSLSNSSNLIKAFDGSDKLDYKDIEITCIVLGDSKFNNYAEITGDSDYNKNEVDDRDSIPGNNKPWNLPEGSTDFVPNNKEDDWDYELLTTKKFDLALQKFITGVNDKEITDREPQVSKGDDGNLVYKHPDTALEVNNGDKITYTIRVYNEGEVAGYAAEIGDNIPNGLVFDSNDEINKKFGWVMYDATGNVTTDSSKATEIRTDYLSKEKSEARGDNSLIQPLYFVDVQVAFTVDAKTSDSTIINTAEITKDTDEDGNEIDDVDSVPDNKKDGEDDMDKEKIHVGYFDLALKKDLTKAIVTVGNSTTEYNAANGELLKVEINRKKINSTIVKFAYNITITNEGTIPGYAKEIKDYVPEGLQFVESDNTNWTAVSNNVITSTALQDRLLQPGESATVEVILRWINGEENLGMKVNVAEISKDYNDANDVDDIDSTPDNKVDGEDDIDNAEVLLSISTGSAPKYMILWTSMLTIIGSGVAMIKKFVL